MLYPIDGNDALVAYGKGEKGDTGEVSDADLAAAISALQGGVVTAGDTLAKLYTLILLRATIAGTVTHTGDHHFVTQSAGNNSTKAATTAYVEGAIANYDAALAIDIAADLAGKQPLDASLTALAALTTAANKFIYFSGADTPVAGDITAMGRALLALSALPITPQGRLTLQTAVPVMSTTQSAKTTIYYTPYHGALVPIYDGTSFTPTVFSELSVATSDTTKSPAAIGASKVNDWFVWSDSGTLRLGHGPDWTNDTTRAAGTALTMVNGILLNNASITNGPAASRGTYVGTTRSNGSSQLDWIFGSSASNGGAAFLYVWNAYNRVDVAATVTDSTASWTYTSVTPHSVNASTGNRVSFVSGLAEDGIDATYGGRIALAAVANDFASVGVALDATNVNDKRAIAFNASGALTLTLFAAARNTYAPQLGAHFVQAMEQSDGTNSATFYGATDHGLHFKFRM